MANDYSTIRVWNETLRGLRLLHANTGVSMVEILQRLVSAELEKTGNEEAEGGVVESPRVSADLTLASKLEVQRTLDGRIWFRVPSISAFTPEQESAAYDAMRDAAVRLGGEFQLAQVTSTVLAKVTGRTKPGRNPLTRKAEKGNG